MLKPGSDDALIRFIFDDKAVKGVRIHLKSALAALNAGRADPPEIKELLAETAVCALMLAASLKGGSEMMLQFAGGRSAPLHYALINVRGDLSFYGSAALRSGATLKPGMSFAEMTGSEGSLTLTIFSPEGRPWQGIVDLNPSGVAASLEAYCANSAQVPTRIFTATTATGGDAAGGIMLQALPGESGADDLADLAVLAASATREELLAPTGTKLLDLLFASARCRVFDPQYPLWRCSCSREGYLKALSSLPQADLDDLISRGSAELTCRHCGRRFTFSAAELKALGENDTHEPA